VNPDNPPSVTEGKTVQEAAASLGQPIQIINASTEGQIEDAFATIAQQRMGALIVSSDPLFFIERKKLVGLTVHYSLPTIFADREQAETGGLISYGASRPDAYRQAGNYIGRVLKGEKPGDAGRAADEIQSAHQLKGREGARHRRPSAIARPR